MSFDTKITPVSGIPFPAFTICNFNKVRKSRAELVENQIKAEPNNELWQKEHLFMKGVCRSRLEEDKGDENLEINGDLIHQFLEDLAQPCDKLLLGKLCN